jgi:molybdopterin-guanine dinucleotide biosynthesis protein A
VPEATVEAFDAIVLAGGRGRRLGGIDKAAVTVGDRTLLDRVLGCCARARRIVVVGPPRATAVPVSWTREEPSGSGPLAAIAAGLAALPNPLASTVAVLATDLPYLTAATVNRLVAERGSDDVVMFEDADGRRQPLCAAYSHDALAGALRRFASVEAVAVRAMLDHLSVRTIRDFEGVARDIDTPDDLDHARAARTEAEPR